MAKSDLKKFIGSIAKTYKEQSGKEHPKMRKVRGKQAYEQKPSPAEAAEKKKKDKEWSAYLKERKARYKREGISE